MKSEWRPMLQTWRKKSVLCAHQYPIRLPVKKNSQQLKFMKLQQSECFNKWSKFNRQYQ